MYRISGRVEMIPSLRRMSEQWWSVLSEHTGHFTDHRRVTSYEGVLTRRYPFPPCTCAWPGARPSGRYIAPANGEKLLPAGAGGGCVATAAKYGVPRGRMSGVFKIGPHRYRPNADKLFLDDVETTGVRETSRMSPYDLSPLSDIFITNATPKDSSLL